MDDKYINSYNKLIRRKKYYFVFVCGVPFTIVALSAISGEKVAFILAGAYGVIFIIWTLFLYFSMCPKCFGLFYGASIKDKGIIGHKFFLNDECNNCGFKISKNT